MRERMALAQALLPTEVSFSTNPEAVGNPEGINEMRSPSSGVIANSASHPALLALLNEVEQVCTVSRFESGAAWCSRAALGHPQEGTSPVWSLQSWRFLCGCKNPFERNIWSP